MPAQDRRHGERRDGDRRSRPGDINVSRIEHENLYGVVTQNSRDIQRLEAELRRVRELLEDLASSLPSTQKRQSA